MKNAKRSLLKMYPTAQAVWFLKPSVTDSFVIICYYEHGDRYYLDSDDKQESLAWQKSYDMVQKQFLKKLEG